MINKEFDGTVHLKNIREDGQHDIEVETSCPLFKYVLVLGKSENQQLFFFLWHTEVKKELYIPALYRL